MNENKWGVYDAEEEDWVVSPVLDTLAEAYAEQGRLEAEAGIEERGTGRYKVKNSAGFGPDD